MKKASRTLYNFQVLKKSLSKDQLLMLYNSVARSILEYASPLFVGLSSMKTQRLERVQKRLHRLLCGSGCKKQTLPALDERCQKSSTKLLRKILSKGPPFYSIAPEVPPTGRVILPNIQTTRRKTSFFPADGIIINDTFMRWRRMSFLHHLPISDFTSHSLSLLFFSQSQFYSLFASLFSKMRKLFPWVSDIIVLHFDCILHVDRNDCLPFYKNKTQIKSINVTS